MIDRVVLKPRKTTTGLDAALYGELGAILAICAKATNDTDSPLRSGSQLSVVAGARNRHYLMHWACPGRDEIARTLRFR
jgi:hypothetical protein